MAVTLRGSCVSGFGAVLTPDNTTTTMNIPYAATWAGAVPVHADLLVLTGCITAAGQTVTQTDGVGAWTIVSCDSNSGGNFTSFTAWRVLGGSDTPPGFSWSMPAFCSFFVAAFIPDLGTTLTMDTTASPLVAITPGTSFTPNPSTAGTTGELSVILNAGIASTGWGTPAEITQTPPTGWTSIDEAGLSSTNGAGINATTAGGCYQVGMSGVVTPAAETLILAGVVSVYATVYHLLFNPAPAVTVRDFSGGATMGAVTANSIATESYGTYGNPPQPGDLGVIVGILAAGFKTVTQTGGTGTWIIQSQGMNNGGQFTDFLAYRIIDTGDTEPTFGWGISSVEIAWTICFFRPTDGMVLGLDVAPLTQVTTLANTFTPPAATATGPGEVSVILTAAQTGATGVNAITQTTPTGWTLIGSTQTSGTSLDVNSYTGVAWQGNQSGTVTPGTETLTCATTLYADMWQVLISVTAPIFPVFAMNVDPPPRPPGWFPAFPGLPMGEPFQAWPYSSTIEAPLPASGPAYATAYGTPVSGTGTWSNPTNAEGSPDGSNATWAVT
jgi:hypothetical protein